jgi:hypothetical protein
VLLLLGAGFSPDPGIAVAAINRTSFSWFERHLCFFAAGSAYGIMHLPLAVALGRSTILPPDLPAARTAFWLIGKTFTGKEILFIRGEDEAFTTVHAL